MGEAGLQTRETPRVSMSPLYCGRFPRLEVGDELLFVLRHHGKRWGLCIRGTFKLEKDLVLSHGPVSCGFAISVLLPVTDSLQGAVLGFTHCFFGNTDKTAVSL